MGISSFPPAAAASGGKTEKVETFKASGTFTVPAGVNYAVATCKGGGGGVGGGGEGTGGTTIVAFSSTVSAVGGVPMGVNTTNMFTSSKEGRNSTANSGTGACMHASSNSANQHAVGDVFGADGAFIVGGSAVTPGAGIIVTVGAGGIAGSFGGAGGSGYVFIQYSE